MKPVKNFCGNWNPDRRVIQFKWDISGLGNDRYIYIVGLFEENGSLRTDMSRSLVFDICDMKNMSPSFTFMKITNLSVGVYKMIFCAYSMEQATNCNDEAIISACLKDSAYVTTVMMGRATISYIANYNTIDNMKMVKIHLKSDSDISEGVLGYKYCIDNCEVITAFPGVIRKGKTQYPPILIPRNCELQIGPLDRQFAGNIVVTQPKSKLLF